MTDVHRTNGLTVSCRVVRNDQLGPRDHHVSPSIVYSNSKTRTTTTTTTHRYLLASSVGPRSPRPAAAREAPPGGLKDPPRPQVYPRRICSRFLEYIVLSCSNRFRCSWARASERSRYRRCWRKSCRTGRSFQPRYVRMVQTYGTEGATRSLAR